MVLEYWLLIITVFQYAIARYFIRIRFEATTTSLTTLFTPSYVTAFEPSYAWSGYQPYATATRLPQAISPPVCQHFTPSSPVTYHLSVTPFYLSFVYVISPQLAIRHLPPILCQYLLPRRHAFVRLVTQVWS